MIKIVVGVVIIIVTLMMWCCVKVGAEADKDIEKMGMELERPDLIQIKK